MKKDNDRDSIATHCSVAADRVQMTSEVSCQRCGTRLLIPLQREWSSPLYVMHMEKEHEMLRELLCHMKDDLLELANECVEAGVRPEIMRRADRMREQFDELKRRFGIE